MLNNRVLLALGSALIFASAANCGRTAQPSKLESSFRLNRIRSPACQDVRVLAKVLELMQAEYMAPEVHKLYRAVCFVGSSTGSSIVRYRSGAIASVDANHAGSTLAYPNGFLASTSAGLRGTVFSYGNSRPWTTSTNTVGVTWYYPNGNVITTSAGVPGVTWYYPDNSVLSTAFGTEGAPWYYPDGSIWVSSGPKLTASQILNAEFDFINYGVNQY